MFVSLPLVHTILLSDYKQNMSSVKVSNIPSSVTDDKIKEFFTFCGKIEGLKVLSNNEKTKSVSVEFANPHAVSTALLLNGAELGGSVIDVTGDEPAKDSGSKDDSDSSENQENDIAQEDKPKSTIFAEYLAAGYKLSDQLVNKAVSFDKDNGISARFKKFLADLDAKYNLHQKNEQLKTGTDANLKKIHDQANASFELDKKLEQGKRTWGSYVDWFKNDKYGSKVHDFYTKTASDVQEVHNEAKRLAGWTDESSATVIDQSKSNAAPPPPYFSSIAPNSATAAAAAAVPFEADKK